LDDNAVIKAMSTSIAHYVCVQTFKRALSGKAVVETQPKLVTPEKLLSSTEPFPWSRPVWEARKCIFNLVPCDNDFERAFAKFLDGAEDVKAFSKLPMVFGFSIDYLDESMNLGYYYPDFVAIDTADTRWLLETKGQETENVKHKDRAARHWCENATNLTGKSWKYLKVPQREFEQLRPSRLSELSLIDSSLTRGQ
jgi:type III restriction enzyme